MNKKDYLILTFLGMYIILQPLAPSSKVEWLLISLIIISAGIYLYELASSEEIRQNFKKDFKPIMLDKFTILFMGLILIMLTSSIYSKHKIASLKEALRFAYYGTVYFLIRFRIQKEYFFEIIIKVYAASLFIVSLIGLYQFFNTYMDGMTLGEILSKARVQSTLGHANSYGAYLILAFFPVLMLALKSNSKKEKTSFFILTLLLSINLVLTYSRNAWISLVIGMFFLVVIYSWKFLLLLLAPVLVAISSPNILLRIKQLANSGVNEGRIRLWTIASKVIKDNFMLGIGSGNFIHTYKDYVKIYPSLQVVEAETLSPHNNYIKILVETGIIGFLVFISLCTVIIIKLYKVRRSSFGLTGTFYNGYLVSVICFFIMNFFEDLFFAPKVTIQFIIFTSIAFGIGYLKEKKEIIN